MWVRRKRLEQLIETNAALAAKVELKETHVAWLERELAYWREQFERERNRAERATDTALTKAGAEPISDLAFEEQERREKEAKKASAELRALNDEIFGEGAAEGEDAAELAEGEIPLSEELIEAVTGMK